MKNNNKGFTLVELIVVMAILGIVATLTALSVGASNSARAEQSATSVNSLISKCRASSLSHAGDFQLTISLDDNGNIVGQYFEGVTLVSSDTFPGKGISVLYTTTVSGTNTTNTLTAESPLMLSFDRSTGAQTNTPSCTAISFTSARTYTITLVPSTGYHHLA